MDKGQDEEGNDYNPFLKEEPMDEKFWLIIRDNFEGAWLEGRRNNDEPPYSNDNGIYQFPIRIYVPEGDDYPVMEVQKNA